LIDISSIIIERALRCQQHLTAPHQVLLQENKLSDALHFYQMKAGCVTYNESSKKQC